MTPWSPTLRRSVLSLSSESIWKRGGSTLANFYQTTRRPIPHYNAFYIHCREKLKSRTCSIYALYFNFWSNGLIFIKFGIEIMPTSYFLISCHQKWKYDWRTYFNHFILYKVLKLCIETKNIPLLLRYYICTWQQQRVDNGKFEPGF